MTTTDLLAYGRHDARTHVNIPSSNMHAYLPSSVRVLWEHVRDLRRRSDEAMSAVAVAAQRLERAPKVDADAVAAAFGAGRSDPGASAVPEARAALADAERVARGFHQAAAEASVELTELIRLHPERVESIEALEDLAEARRALCEQKIGEAESARAEAWSARQLSLFLDQCPGRVAQPGQSGRWGEVAQRAREDLSLIMEPVPAALGGPAEAPVQVW